MISVLIILIITFYFILDYKIGKHLDYIQDIANIIEEQNKDIKKLGSCVISLGKIVKELAKEKDND